jgi:ABC-type branched-subunit amino acid transport system substrate-binding protein
MTFFFKENIFKLKSKLHFRKPKRLTVLNCFMPLLIAALVFGGCSNPESEQQEYITVGALFPLTGESLEGGVRSIAGLKIIKKKIEDEGGILGKKLDIIILNDRGDEDYALRQYNILKEKGAIAIIGSSHPGVTSAIAKAVEKDGMLLVVPDTSDVPNANATNNRKNVYYQSPLSRDSHPRVVSYYTRKYRALYGGRPQPTSGASYACAFMLTEAIKRAGNTNVDDIISAIWANESNLTKDKTIK